MISAPASAVLWLNGALLSDRPAAIRPEDRGFLLGDGLFETMRVVEGHVPRLDDHLGRLTAGAACLQIPVPDPVFIRDGVRALLTANGKDEPGSHGSIRLTLTRGTGPRGLLPPDPARPTLLMTMAPAAAAPGPARLGISRYRRDGGSPLCALKTLAYLPQIMTRLEAAQNGYDDALMLSVDGCHVAEASAATVVLLRNGRLVTPPLQDGALAGLSRAKLLADGLCETGSVTVEDCQRAEAMWLINCLSLRPVACVGETMLAKAPDWQGRIAASLFGLKKPGPEEGRHRAVLSE